MTHLPPDYTGSLIGSYVCHPSSGKWWNVSTITRESSAALAPDVIYDETIVWVWDPRAKTRGGMIECREGGLAYHFDACRALHTTGDLPKEDDDE